MERELLDAADATTTLANRREADGSPEAARMYHAKAARLRARAVAWAGEVRYQEGLADGGNQFASAVVEVLARLTGGLGEAPVEPLAVPIPAPAVGQVWNWRDIDIWRETVLLRRPPEFAGWEGRGTNGTLGFFDDEDFDGETMRFVRAAGDTPAKEGP